MRHYKFPDGYACRNALLKSPGLTGRVPAAGVIEVVRVSLAGAARGEFAHIRRGAVGTQGE